MDRHQDSAMAPMKFSLSKRGPAAGRPPKPGNQEDEQIVEQIAEEHFETVTLPTWPVEGEQYGLFLRKKDFEEHFEHFETVTLPTGPVEGEQYGLFLRKKDSSPVNGDVQDLEEQRFRQQVEELADEVSMDVLESMPIAHAMLRGMGWERGKPIGRSARADYVRHYGTAGLGATPFTLKEGRKKISKPGESREKPVQREDGISNDKVMAIVAGKHSGLRGEVVLKKGGDEDSDKFNMRLLKSELVEVLTSEV